MSRKDTIDSVEKVKIVERILANEVGINEAARLEKSNHAQAEEAAT